MFQMKRLALLLLWSTAVLASTAGDSSPSTTEASTTARSTPVVATTPSAPGSTKKVTPTPESSKSDATAPYIVHAQSSPWDGDSATARSVHPMSAHARPFRPSVQLLSRSDSFTGQEPVYDVQLSSALHDDSVMMPSTSQHAASSAWPQRMPVGPVTVYTTPTPYIPPVAQPRPHHLNMGSSYNVRPQHTAQTPYRPRRPHPPPMANRRVPMTGGRPPPPGLYRPVRQPMGPPRPHQQHHHQQQQPFYLYSKPPPEVVYFGDHPPPLDYQPPSPRRPPHRPAYFSRPIPQEDEEDIMNMLDHYIPDDEPHVVRKEPKNSPLSSMMMPMMLSGLIMPLFGMMFTFLSKRRRRRDLSAVDHQKSDDDDVDFLLEMLNSAVEKMEKKSA